MMSKVVNILVSVHKLRDTERRRAFRINLLDQVCIFEFIDFGDKLLEPLMQRKGEGKIKNIGRTGIKLSCELICLSENRFFCNSILCLMMRSLLLKERLYEKRN